MAILVEGLLASDHTLHVSRVHNRPQPCLKVLVQNHPKLHMINLGTTKFAKDQT